MDIDILKKLGFSDKSAQIYLALLQLGPSPIRQLAEFCDLNRGTTYDNLKWLKEKGVVDFYKNESKQHFVAEKPEKLLNVFRHKKEEIESAEHDLGKLILELDALHDKGGKRPIARYYSKKEIGKILEDVLDTCEKNDELIYRIYSSIGIREYLYESFSTFSDARIGKGISVKAIAMGEGGELRGLDERKWLKSNVSTPTYIIIYPGKTAYISLNAKKELVGVVIENQGIYQTQKIIFDSLWEKI